uniref:Tetraspanin n=1 Tax=Plectus sambesii TaxID=2011161 RepID=A0A914VRJ5_9BILA
QECCGSTGSSDWAESGWRTEAATNGEDAGLVPITCCTQLDGATALNPIAKSFGRCQQPDAGREWRHLEGCHAKLQQWFDFHSFIFIAVGFGFAAFQLIGIIAAICLCRQIHDYTYI